MPFPAAPLPALSKMPHMGLGSLEQEKDSEKFAQEQAEWTFYYLGPALVSSALFCV